MATSAVSEPGRRRRCRPAPTLMPMSGPVQPGERLLVGDVVAEEDRRGGAGLVAEHVQRVALVGCDTESSMTALPSVRTRPARWPVRACTAASTCCADLGARPGARAPRCWPAWPPGGRPGRRRRPAVQALLRATVQRLGAPASRACTKPTSNSEPWLPTRCTSPAAGTASQGHAARDRRSPPPWSRAGGQRTQRGHRLRWSAVPSSGIGHDRGERAVVVAGDKQPRRSCQLHERATELRGEGLGGHAPPPQASGDFRGIQLWVTLVPTLKRISSASWIREPRGTTAPSGRRHGSGPDGAVRASGGGPRPDPRRGRRTTSFFTPSRSCGLTRNALAAAPRPRRRTR